MERRITTRTVTFRHAFWLSGFESPQPAGIYTVDTEEEALDTLSIIGSRHVSTIIRLMRYGATDHVSIDPQELHAALLHDGNPSVLPGGQTKQRLPRP